MFLKVIDSVLIETSNLDGDGNPIPAKKVSFAMFDSREDLTDEIDNGLQKSRLFPQDFAVTTASGSPRVMRGSIKTFETTPYTIGQNTVTKRSVVVFDSESGVEIANAQLKSNGACVVLNGKPTVDLVKAPAQPTGLVQNEPAKVGP
jgi:hypothetical protein